MNVRELIGAINSETVRETCSAIDAQKNTSAW